MSKEEDKMIMNKVEGANDYARKLNGISDSEDRLVLTAAIEGILAGYSLSKGDNNGV